ncbi:MAG: response regulator transcription factor [Lachnospiraceae bacterium]|nr:response regulator transcription factor [Lachnospiraceae bacterium]MBQ9593839.1 response regulator transcription factor [Lachnospiraceae bacterium]
MIFCVDDDPSILDLMIYSLQLGGLTAKGFPDADTFWEAMKTERPQLIVLDIMLPGEDGISVLKKLRSSPLTESIPVIMATARGDEYDRVTGLDLGADDYLSKPFGMMEMVSRIKAVLRRTSVQDVRLVLRYKDLTLDHSRHLVSCRGSEVILTLKEYEILKLFMENIGVVLTRDRLLTMIWGQNYTGETRTVDVHIGTLRSKLGSCGDLIQTVRGVGYRME